MSRLTVTVRPRAAWARPARLVSPLPDGSGDFLVAEYDGDAVREISGESPFATFSTVAGIPQGIGYSGDGGAATAAHLNHPEQVTSLPAGGFPDRGYRQRGDPRGVDLRGPSRRSPATASRHSRGMVARRRRLRSRTPTAVASLPNGNILIAEPGQQSDPRDHDPGHFELQSQPREPKRSERLVCHRSDAEHAGD